MLLEEYLKFSVTKEPFLLKLFLMNITSGWYEYLRSLRICSNLSFVDVKTIVEMRDSTKCN